MVARRYEYYFRDISSTARDIGSTAAKPSIRERRDFHILKLVYKALFSSTWPSYSMLLWKKLNIHAPYALVLPQDLLFL
jgi:hypothetical protein